MGRGDHLRPDLLDIKKKLPDYGNKQLKGDKINTCLLTELFQKK